MADTPIVQSPKERSSTTVVSSVVLREKVAPSGPFRGHRIDRLKKGVAEIEKLGFKVKYGDHIPKGYKLCTRPEYGDTDKIDGFYVDAETIFYQDDHVEPECHLFTGPKFGCLHHITKKPTEVR